jgi:hypothetical protein
MPSRPVPPAAGLGRHAAPPRTAPAPPPTGLPRRLRVSPSSARVLPPSPSPRRLRVLPAPAPRADRRLGVPSPRLRVPPSSAPRATRRLREPTPATPRRIASPAPPRVSSIPRGPTATVCKNCHPSDSFCTRYSAIPHVPASARCLRPACHRAGTVCFPAASTCAALGLSRAACACHPCWRRVRPVGSACCHHRHGTTDREPRPASGPSPAALPLPCAKTVTPATVFAHAIQ